RRVRSAASRQELGLGPGPRTSATRNGTRPRFGLTWGSVAHLSTGLGPSAISREDRTRRVEIQAPMSGRPLGPIVADAGAIMRTITLPQGYRWEFGPEIKLGETTFNQMWLAVAL